MILRLHPSGWSKNPDSVIWDLMPFSMHCQKNVKKLQYKSNKVTKTNCRTGEFLSARGNPELLLAA